MLIRVIANGIILVGLFLLGRVICHTASGGLAAQYPALLPGLGANGLFALGLSLPVPMHVIAVGLILQKKWLAHRWARIAWWAVVFSGCWLGAALVIKLVYLSST
ncbi:MAG: hypothetical protein JJV98_13640 [Desulfosarcina sp.]|nr:hypothetical protein [Desulfobacterales bacterium]